MFHSSAYLVRKVTFVKSFFDECQYYRMSRKTITITISNSIKPISTREKLIFNYLQPNQRSFCSQTKMLPYHIRVGLFFYNVERCLFSLFHAQFYKIRDQDHIKIKSFGQPNLRCFIHVFVSDNFIHTAACLLLLVDSLFHAQLFKI